MSIFDLLIGGSIFILIVLASVKAVKIKNFNCCKNCEYCKRKYKDNK